tara:strand:+ start:10947 stop:11579 length:633 start_codon:yes stop_codon:yes gene_type:complete
MIINQIINRENQQIIFELISLLISSSILRLVIEKIGQKWICTFSHTATLLILPITTYIITKVISGNIILSLGMVGALSIVRFRNPVRSPFELSIYFAVITMGIAMTVSYEYSILLTFILILVLICLYSINKFSKKQIFINSFSEGNSYSSLELLSTEEIPLLENSQLLKSKSMENNQFSYLLISSSSNKINFLLESIKNFKSIIKYSFNK